jgi:hypothetical protein
MLWDKNHHIIFSYFSLCIFIGTNYKAFIIPLSPNINGMPSEQLFILVILKFSTDKLKLINLWVI